MTQLKFRDNTPQIKSEKIIPFKPKAADLQSWEEKFRRTEAKLRRAEARLKKAESIQEKFQAVFHHLFQFIGILDPQGKVVEANRRILQFAGLEMEKIKGRNFWSIGLLGRSPSRIKLVREMTLRAAQGESVRRELEITGCPGQAITVDFSITPVFGPDGGITMLIPEARDISSRILMEESLRESEKYYRSLFEQAHDAILIFDPANERVLDVNQVACTLYGFSRNEFLSLSLEQVTGDVKQGKKKLRQLVQEGSLNNYETLHFRKQGEAMWMEVNATTFVYRGRDAILCVMRDITERKLNEEHILQAAIKAQDDERKRFSTELHDGLGQLLSAVRMQFHFLLKAGERLQEKEQEVLNASLGILQSCVQEVRNISWNLMPASLEKFGLATCLNELAEIISMASGIEISFEREGLAEDERFSPEKELCAFRVVQELVNNAVKHAQAEKISILFRKKGNALQFIVTDNGSGMQEGNSRIPGSGNGMRNLQSRVKLMNGKFECKSSKGKGTKITIEIPIGGEYENTGTYCG